MDKNGRTVAWEEGAAISESGDCLLQSRHWHVLISASMATDCANGQMAICLLRVTVVTLAPAPWHLIVTLAYTNQSTVAMSMSEVLPVFEWGPGKQPVQHVQVVLGTVSAEIFDSAVATEGSSRWSEVCASSFPCHSLEWWGTRRCHRCFYLQQTKQQGH